MDRKSNVMHNVSIIIPHYNSPELLEKLINTIPDLDEIQIIVVDDNSTKNIDDYEKLKEKYKSKVAFYTNNTGIQSAGACRNVALQHADGKWLLFSDADDYFVDGWYEIVRKYIDSDYDAVYFTPMSIFLDTGEPANRHIFHVERIKKYLNNPSRENYLRFASLTTTCSRLIRRSVFERNNINYSCTRHANDVLCSKKIFCYCEKKFFTDEVIYCITRSSGSLTTKMSELSFRETIVETSRAYCFLKEHFDKSDMRSIDFACGTYVFDGYKKGIGLKSIIWAIFYLMKHRSQILPRRYLSLAAFFAAIKKSNANYSLDRHYFVK